MRWGSGSMLFTVAVALTSALAPAAASAQSRDRAEQTITYVNGGPMWNAHGVAPGEPSYGMAFGCARNVSFTVQGADGADVAVNLGRDRAIIIPRRNAQGLMEMLVVPNDLITAERTAERLGYEQRGRSFIMIPRSNYTVETTGNLRYNPETGRMVSNPGFAANAAAGRAVVALPAFIDADGMVQINHSLNGGRAYNPSMDAVAVALGQRQIVQAERTMGQNNRYTLQGHAVCG